MIFTFLVLDEQYALTVVTKYKGNNDKYDSHLSLFKGGSMGVKYKSNMLSAKYKNLEKTFKCIKVSKEFKTDY